MGSMLNIVALSNNGHRKSDRTDVVFVVTHGESIRLLLGHLQNIPIANVMLTERRDNSSFTKIECTQTRDANVIQ